MSLDDVEIASRYGALDQEAASDGGFVHAHVLRALSRSMNQLLGEGGELLTLLFDARAEADSGQQERALIAVAPLLWCRTLPGVFMRPKKPGLNRADIAFRATIQNGEVAQVQIETLRRGVDPSVGGLSGQGARFVGTGGVQTYWLRDVAIDEGALERFGFWIRAVPGETLGDTGARTAGGHNTGVIANNLNSNGLLIDGSGSTRGWNFTLPNMPWSPDHYLLVHDGPDAVTIGSPMFQAQIVSVESADSLRVFPAPDYYLGDNLRGHYYQIRRLPTLRCRSISAFTNDRTVW